MDIQQAGDLANKLIAEEIARQNYIWGDMNERADISQDQLMLAGMAQLDALFDRFNGESGAFDTPPAIYPPDWSGFRDYGSNVANLVVAVAFLTQEIKHRIFRGEDTVRLPRRPDQQYGENAPAKSVA